METTTSLRVSKMAENLIGSEIIKLAGEINEKIKNGEKIYNLTIGDFNPKIFPIPTRLKELILEAYQNNETNYPPADGILDLRNEVSKFLRKHFELDYKSDTIMIAGGARPLIYGIFQTIVDPGDKIIFPVPSWNNNHYTHLSRGEMVLVQTSPENNFMPSASDLIPHLNDAVLVALCSPLNPTGTTFTENGLAEICDAIIKENNRRGPNEKPLLLMYDQIYSALTFGDTKHFNPVSLRPEMKNFTIFVDGISKSLAATGVRVGWAFGPKKIIDKMKNIIGHVGAWSPRAEQVATANFIKETLESDSFTPVFKTEIIERLTAFYEGFLSLKAEGFNVDVIAPQAAIYLTVKIDLKGKTTLNGNVLTTTKEVTQYILDEAKVGIVPFSAFGSGDDSTWYRISVGTCLISDINGIINNLREAFKKLI